MALVLDKPQPDWADRGDRLTVVIHTDNLYTVRSVSFGKGIDVITFVAHDAYLGVKIAIAQDAPVGPHDITVTNNIETATLQAAFDVR